MFIPKLLGPGSSNLVCSTLLYRTLLIFSWPSFRVKEVIKLIPLDFFQKLTGVKKRSDWCQRSLMTFSSELWSFHFKLGAYKPPKWGIKLSRIWDAILVIQITVIIKVTHYTAPSCKVRDYWNDGCPRLSILLCISATSWHITSIL